MVTPEGGRVLGCLVEKQLTTPQQYPLTANALALACSQSTNREPVITMDDEQVLLVLDALREEKLVRFVLPSHGRSAVRYRHVLDERYGLDEDALALIAVLVLRGPQTLGELRTRTARMAGFAELDDVAAVLHRLSDGPEPLVELLTRRPGQKEDRYVQLLAAPWPGTTGPSAFYEEHAPSSSQTSDIEHMDRTDGTVATNEDVAALREELSSLREQLEALSRTVDDLRRSLGE